MSRCNTTNQPLAKKLCSSKKWHVSFRVLVSVLSGADVLGGSLRIRWPWNETNNLLVAYFSYVPINGMFSHIIYTLGTKHAKGIPGLLQENRVWKAARSLLPGLSEEVKCRRNESDVLQGNLVIVSSSLSWLVRRFGPTGLSVRRLARLPQFCSLQSGGFTHPVWASTCKTSLRLIPRMAPRICPHERYSSQVAHICRGSQSTGLPAVSWRPLLETFVENGYWPFKCLKHLSDEVVGPYQNELC